MESITLYAYAKLNLALAVLGKREDGYHNMEMLMQSVSLHDTLRLARAEDGIRLFCGRSDLSGGNDNIAYRAAEQFFQFTGRKGGVEIHLEKKIPLQAGMAGGSADAAAVLTGLNFLYDAGLSQDQLSALGVKLGADVPFCLTGGTAHVTGMGERVAPVSPLPSCYFVIVKPEAGISTGAAFQAVDNCTTLRKVDVSRALKGVSYADMHEIAVSMDNTFEQVTVLDEVFDIKRQLLQKGALGSLMSGSGSAVFGLFQEKAAANAAREAFSPLYREVYLTEPVDCGVKIL